MKIKIFILASVFFYINTFSQNQFTDSLKYFPIQSGNQWFYKRGYQLTPGYPVYSKIVSKITDTLRINGTLYYQCINFTGKEGNNVYLRYDTLNGSLNYHYPDTNCNNERVYRLAANVGFNVGQCAPYNYNCNSAGYITIFNTNTRFKTFNTLILPFQWSSYIKFVKDFGISYHKQIFTMPAETDFPSDYIYTYELYGAILNGILYGDTNVLSIKKLDSETPEKFSLVQNYPNPFNSMTFIRFQVAKSNIIKLIVFDITGKEIVTMVNESLEPGTYEVRFNGHHLPSGIYFYRMQTTDYIETKKCILLK